MYINDANDYILFTWFGLRWVSGVVVQLIPFDSIVSIELPPNEDEDRVLKLILHDGKIVLLPVVNDTDDQADFYLVRDVLTSIIYWPHESTNTEQIHNIQSRIDLADFIDLETQSSWRSPKSSALRRGFPKPWLLEHFSIGADLLERPDLWRLLALLLVDHPDEPEPDNRGSGPRPSEARVEEYFRVGDSDDGAERD